MTVEFPRLRQPKPEVPLPCTTRTMHSADARAAQLWEAAEATLQTEISREVLAEASSIADAERARTPMVDGFTAFGTSVTLTCQGGISVTGKLDATGRDFVLIAREGHRVTGIQLSTVTRVMGVVHGLPRVRESSDVHALLTWTQWLRSIHEQEVGPVRIVASDGWMSEGVIRYVGMDFLRMAGDHGQEIDVMLCAISSVTVPSMHLAE